MASRKRGRDCEDVDISEMSTSMFANVHGLVVGDLSPVTSLHVCVRPRVTSFSPISTLDNVSF